MAAGNQRKNLVFTLRCKRLLLAHEIKYICMNTSPIVNREMIKFIPGSSLTSYR